MEIDARQLKIRLGGYATGPSTALPDPRWLGQAQHYRRTASARMIPLDRRGLERRLPAEDYFVSRKVDGEFTAVIFDGGEAVSVNPGGTVRRGLPCLREAGERLEAAGCRGTTLLAAELYFDRSDGRRPRVHDVTRVVRNPQSEDDLARLKLAVFDIMVWDGDESSRPYAEVWERLSAVFEKGERIHPVKTVRLRKPKEILEQFERWVIEEGAEGLVARSEVAGLFKIKPRHDLDAVAVGFTEGIDDRAGLLHDILLALVRKDGSFQILGRVGGGFTEDQRREILSDLRDLAVESDYAEVNSDRVAYQMIRPERVLEISCLDVISQTTRGGSINRMVIGWDDAARRWHTERRLPLASVLSPEFVRFRDDRSPTPADAGVDQLTAIVEIEDTDKTLRDLELPRSELLKRVVYTKELRGQTLVRKLLLWKTCKESHSAAYPAYVLYHTDYSPNRKSALDRDIRVSHSRDQLEKLWHVMAEKAFVRGWKPVEGEGSGVEEGA